jgi:DNA-binding MarR family transcriptional regulator
MDNKYKTNMLEQLIPKLETLVYRIGVQYPQKKVVSFFAPNDSLKALDIGISESRVIECIRSNHSINAVNISQKVLITKSGISKIMLRLKKKGLINAVHPENNRKEILYTLTDKGHQVALIHLEVYKGLYDKYFKLLESYSEEELICISRFVNDLTTMP